MSSTPEGRSALTVGDRVRVTFNDPDGFFTGRVVAVGPGVFAEDSLVDVKGADGGVYPWRARDLIRVDVVTQLGDLAR